MSPTSNATAKGQAAEFPDDAKISGGANYTFRSPTEPSFRVPGYRYFAAIDSKEDRPDSVASLKRMGYEICTEETITSTECVLMRIPIAEREKREEPLRQARTAQLSQGDAISGVPEEAMFRQPGHGRMRKVR